MNFEQFQNQSRLYVIGALEAEELEEFEKAREKFGKKAEDFITKCYALHEAFALSLRPAKSSDAIKERLMAMVKSQEATLISRPSFSQPVQLAQDKFLQETVEVYLEQAQVAARSDRRTKVVA